MFALRLLAFGALVWPTDAGFAPGFGGAGFLLVGPLEVGASASAETALFTYNRLSIASHLGLRAPIDRLELDAAATLGYSDMRNGKPGLLSDNPGATGGSAFVGARAGAEYAVFRSASRKVQIVVAVVFSYEHDLSQYTQAYRYEETGWLSDEPTTYDDSARIGMDRVAILIGAGIGFN